MFRTSCLCGAALAALAFGSIAAHAQSSAEPSGAAVSAGGELEDIVVTAQKRSERLQDVPIAVTAVSGSTLQTYGAVNTDELNLVAPALNTQRLGTFSLPILRGISTTVVAVGAEANIATYVDGVYRPAIFSQLADFNSIERVEVLKGPQGTLFGRNATGGAISIITKSPSVSETTGDVSLSYGRFNEVTGMAYVNLPVSDKVAVNVAAYGLHRDGYIRNLFLNRDVGSVNNWAVRAKVLFQPSDTATFTLTGEYADQRDLSSSAVYAINGNQAVKATAAFLGLPAPIFGDRYRTTGLSYNNSQSIKTFGGSLLAEFNFDGFDIISLSNVLYSGIDSFLDIDNSSTRYLDLDYGPKNLSGGEDLRIQSAGDGPFTWSVGANLFLAKEWLDPQVVIIPPFGLSSQTLARSNTFAVALYGQGSLAVTDQLTVTVGARANFERKEAEFEGPDDGIPLTRATKKWKNLSPKVAIDYKLTPRTMIYASFSQGWKSGLFNPASYTPVPADPENLYAYEAGFKSDLTRNLRLNVSGFFYDYRNIQVSSFLSGATIQIVQNAATAHLYGIDAELSSTFDGLLTGNDRLDFSGGLSWVHAQYRSFPGAARQVPIVDPILGQIGNTPESFDASGNHLPQSPRLTMTGNLTYSVPNASGTWSVNANAYYNSGWYADANNTYDYRQDRYVKIGANLGWKSPDERLGITIWGRNLNNAKTHSLITPTGVGVHTGSLLPRTFGIRANYSFR